MGRKAKHPGSLSSENPTNSLTELERIINSMRVEMGIIEIPKIKTTNDYISKLEVQTLTDRITEEAEHKKRKKILEDKIKMDMQLQDITRIQREREIRAKIWRDEEGFPKPQIEVQETKKDSLTTRFIAWLKKKN